MDHTLKASRLLRRGLCLEYATLGWNVVGCIVIGLAAVRTGSAAFAGFGLDSLIEILASVIVVWQLKGADQGRESRALRLIGGAFFLLAIYVLGQSVWTLLAASRPGVSFFGIAWMTATLGAMLLLAWGKHVTGHQLGNPVLTAESRVTLIDAALAAAVLLGTGLNALFGWWWADPLAGLLIVYYGIKEGRAAWSHSSET